MICNNCNGELGTRYQEEINRKTKHSYHYYHIRKSFRAICNNPKPLEEMEVKIKLPKKVI